MLSIRCPWCGPRCESEFCCGGEAHLERPVPAEQVTDEQWAQYLFYRDNTKGVYCERWCHRHGCGQWFNVARDTITHEIFAVYSMGEGKPAFHGDRE